MGRITGKVKWFNDAKGWGFITPDKGGNDVYAHFTEIQQEGFRSLTEGEKVSFILKEGNHGPSATDIRTKNSPPPTPVSISPLKIAEKQFIKAALEARDKGFDALCLTCYQGFSNHSCHGG